MLCPSHFLPPLTKTKFPTTLSTVNNVSNSAAIYTTELTMSGQKFLVQLDSGSSDLWLDTTGVDLSSFTDTGVNGSITYGDKTVAQGPILIGNVTVGTFSASQAFISAPGTNATTYNDKGLLGVGPPLLSVINKDLNGTSFDGSMFLKNVFNADPTLKEFISFALSRSETTGTTGGGIFTVGEIPSNLTAVSSSPQLGVISALNRWTVFMDGMVVNGKNVSGNSAFSSIGIPGQGPQQTLANLDTGTGLATVPKVYADAIYGSIPGATFNEAAGIYEVPCDTRINAGVGDDGSITCFSGFAPIDVDPNENTEDLILGDIYAVFNFGEFISGTSAPTIQLLSTTDADKAYTEFDTLSTQRNQSLTSAGVSSGSSTSSASKRNAVAASRLEQFGTCIGILAMGLLSGALIL